LGINEKIMRTIFDKKLLTPIALKIQPELEVCIVPMELKNKWDGVMADQALRLRPNETERLMAVLDKSVGRLGKNNDGATAFAGVVRHPASGLTTVRGSGRIFGNEAMASGCFVANGENVIFQVDTCRADIPDVEKMLSGYEELVEGVGWGEVTEITLGYEPLIHAGVRELRDHGKPVMHTTNPEAVREIEVASFVPRVVGRIGMQIGTKIAGKTVGMFGNVENKLEPMKKIKGLIGG
jgi:hypothetical protein